MDAIEKAKVAEFRTKLVEQLKQAQDQLVNTNLNTQRMQGALAACDYILALDPVTLDDRDEVTEADLADAASYTAREAIA